MFVFLQGFAPFFPLLVPTVQVELIFQIDFNKVSCTCAIAFPFSEMVSLAMCVESCYMSEDKRKLPLNSPSNGLDGPLFVDYPSHLNPHPCDCLLL